MGNVVHHSHKDTKQNMTDMVSLDTCHGNDDEVNKQRFLLAHNLQPSQGQTRVESPGVEPRGSAMSRRSEELKSSLPNGNLFQSKSQPNLSHVATPESELSDHSQPTSPSSSNGSSSGVTTSSNGSGVAGVAQVAAVQPIISNPTPQNREMDSGASPTNSLKGSTVSSRDNGLLKELLSSMDIPESILKTKITSLLMSDKGNDQTISDILKKIMELSKTSDETSSETDKSKPGEANCSKSTTHSKRKQNDNTELRKLLFGNRSVARESTEHPDRALYSYPSVTPSQILTGPPMMRGRGRPPRRRGLRPDPPEHQAIRSRENGDTPVEPNPSMMPMPYGVREFGTDLTIENGTVQNYPVQIGQTTVCRNKATYPAAPLPYQPYPNEYCPDCALFIKGNGRSRSHDATDFGNDTAMADSMSNGYGLPNPNKLLNAQSLCRPFGTFHRPGTVTGSVEGNVTYNGLSPPEIAAVDYSVRPETGLQHAKIMNRNDSHPGLPQDNHMDSEITVNWKSLGRVGGSSRLRPTRDLGLPDLLKRMLDDKLDEVPAKRSKRNSNIPHLEKYDNESDSSYSNDNTNNNNDQNGNSFKKFDFVTEEPIRQLLISTIQSEIKDEKRKAKQRTSDEHAEKSVTPDSHVDVVLYEASDDSIDLLTLVTDEAGNALDFSHHCSESDDVEVVGEECGALDLTYKTSDVKPEIMHEEHTESSLNSMITFDKNNMPSINTDASPGLEFYGHGRYLDRAPSFTSAGSTQHPVGDTLPRFPPGPGRCVRPQPPSAGMPPDSPPPPPPLPPAMDGNEPCYSIKHPGCTGNQEQQRCGYFHPPSLQQLQQHPPPHPQQHPAYLQQHPPPPEQYPSHLQQHPQQHPSHPQQHPSPSQHQSHPQQHPPPHPQQHTKLPSPQQHPSHPQQYLSQPQQHLPHPQQHLLHPQQHASHQQQHPPLPQRHSSTSQLPQHQQQHSPTCCRFSQQQCSPWNHQAIFLDRFPGPGPRIVQPGNPRPPPQAYNSMLSLRQPPPNITVYNSVPRNQPNMSHFVRYAQAPGPPTNAPRPLSYQQTPTVDGKIYQHQHHRGTS